MGDVPAYPIANSCSGFWPSPLPPSDRGIARCSSTPSSSSDLTVPLRPCPCAVACAVYYIHGLGHALHACNALGAHLMVLKGHQRPPASNCDPRCGSHMHRTTESCRQHLEGGLTQRMRWRGSERTGSKDILKSSMLYGKHIGGCSACGYRASSWPRAAMADAEALKKRFGAYFVSLPDHHVRRSSCQGRGLILNSLRPATLQYWNTVVKMRLVSITDLHRDTRLIQLLLVVSAHPS